MKAVILGKASSVRVKFKNYRPFYGDLSLTDILLEKLIKVLDREDIYLSCEDISFKDVADRWGINFINRDVKYTLLSTDTVEVVRNVCKDVPGDDDILYCSGMDPLFDDYEDLFSLWEEARASHDSLNVVYPMKKYFLDQNYHPIGFEFGHWHKYSQYMPATYQISWANLILKRETIDSVGYMVGINPFWFFANNPTVDIDTQEDWELARVIYKYYRERKHSSGVN